MSVGPVWGCNDEYASNVNKNELTPNAINYESTWEYHEDGRASAWRNEDRTVLIDFDVINANGVVSSQDGYSTVVRDSARQRTYRYDFFADDGANENRNADVYVRECEGCDWDRLVLMGSGTTASQTDVKNTAQQQNSTHASRFSLNRQFRNDLTRMGVQTTENRFGAVRVDPSNPSQDSSLNSIESWEDVTTFGALEDADIAPAGTQRHNSHNFLDFLEFLDTLNHPIEPKPPGTCPLPSGMTCDQIQEAIVYAQLSGCAYDSSNCPNGWDVIDPADLGLDPDFLDYGAYHAVILHNPITNEYVVAFEGTNGLSPSDWTSNIQNYYNTTSPLHYNYAANLGRGVSDALEAHDPNATLTFTGHSLGGGAASIAALAAGAPAVVFNSAAVSEHTLHENQINIVGNENLIDVINVSGDPVAHFQADNNWPALGAHYTIGNHGNDPNIQSHFLETVHLELEQIYRDNCP